MQLREMNEDIAAAWLSAERVTALKLATRVARLLSDTSVPAFYPTLFVLVTEARPLHPPTRIALLRRQRRTRAGGPTRPYRLIS